MKKGYITCSGWKTTLLTSVFFILASVFLPHGTMLTGFCGCRYRCSRMLDGLVSSHPKTLAPGGRKKKKMVIWHGTPEDLRLRHFRLPPSDSPTGWRWTEWTDWALTTPTTTKKIFWYFGGWFLPPIERCASEQVASYAQSFESGGTK